MMLKKAPTTVVAMKLLIGCITVMWAVFDWCRRRTFTDRNCINRHNGLFVLEGLVPRPRSTTAGNTMRSNALVEFPSVVRPASNLASYSPDKIDRHWSEGDYLQSTASSRRTPLLAGFFIFSQYGDRPDR